MIKRQRPCHCGECNRCVLFETNAAINLLWGGDGKVRLLRPGEGRQTGQVAAPTTTAPKPGTELKVILAELGIADAVGCGCASRVAEMDARGPVWCQEHRAEIVGWLKEAAASRGWVEKARAAARAVLGLAFRPDPRDVYGSLVDEAVRRAEAKAVPPAPLPPPDPPPAAGIVVGTYGLPQLARLQVLLIRETCGAVPVLFADDGAEADHPGTDAAFHDLCDEFPGVTYWPNAERRGHYAGDLSVFWKGLQWAERTDLRWLCKLSQRFLWTRRDWLADAVQQLDAGGLATMYQGCIDDGINLYVRSECVLMDAVAWRPYAGLFDRPRLHNATEFYVNDLVHRHFGGKFERWKEIPIVREIPPKPGAFVWHTCHGDQEYAEIHKRYGVPTDQRGGNQSMTAAGWMAVPNWKKG
jgi:uncharacterized protein CbrC (UPF0167 family)